MMFECKINNNKSCVAGNLYDLTNSHKINIHVISLYFFQRPQSPVWNNVSDLQHGKGPLGWRMSFSCIRLSKICFLLSVIFCAVLLLLLPKFQNSWKRNYPQPRPPVVFNASSKTDIPLQHVESSSVDHLEDETNNIVPLVKKELVKKWTHYATDTGKPKLKANRKMNDSPVNPLHNVAKDHMGPDEVSAKEKLELKDIFIAIKTTRKYHKTRLNLLFQTWISQAKGQVRILFLES